MVKIALDPAMYHVDHSVADEIRKAADLGYEHLELSPRPDWFFWHRYPKADDDADRRGKQGLQGDRGDDADPGPGVQLVRPPTSRSGRPRCATGSGCWRSPTRVECPTIVSELSGDPNRPAAVRARLLRLDGGADPGLRAVRHRAQPGGAPVRLLRDQRRRGADHPRAEPALGELRVLRPARLPPLAGRGRRAPDDGVRRQQAASTCTWRTASTTWPTWATATSSTRPGWTPGSTSTTRSATATSTGTSSSARCATSSSTAWPRSACSAGRRTPTRSTAGCWTS